MGTEIQEFKQTGDQSTGFTTQNLISIGIYNVVLFIVFFVVGIVGFIPVAYIFFYILEGIALAPIFILLVRRSPKRGTIAITGIIQSLLWVLIGNLYIFIPILVGGILAEIATSSIGYNNKRGVLTGYFIFVLGMFVGSFGAMIFLTDFWADTVRSIGWDDEYLNAVLDLAKSPIMIVSTVLSLGSTVFGGFLGYRLLDRYNLN